MISSKSGPWAALALLAGGMVAGPVAHAQTIEFKYGNTRIPDDPATELSRYIRALATSPRSLSALKGAASASLELGDPQTALTFLARAEEVAPRDGEVKAGMGSAFVLMEEPEAALRFFTEAQSLGEAEATFAKDRGLAYDLTGDPLRAQADYALALKRRDDNETRERLALSLAISGDRQGALAAIDKLVRNQNRSAWRTRAFVLALTGDAAGATQAAEAVMPAQAAEWRPFFARLPALNPAERAMAVHFGRFPVGSTADPTRYAENSQTQAGQPDPAQGALGGKRKPANETRKRPDNRAASVAGERQAARGGSKDKAGKAKPEAQQVAAQAPTEKPAPASAAPASTRPPTALAASQPAAAGNKATTPPPSATTDMANRKAAAGNLIGPSASSSAAPGRAASPAVSSARTGAKTPLARTPFGPPTSGTPPTLAQITAEREAAAGAPDPGADFSSVTAAVEALPTPLRNAPPKAPASAAKPALRSAKPETAKPDAKNAKGKDAPAAKSGEKDTKAADAKKKAEPAKPAKSSEPSRIWVQVAGGANKADLPKAFNQLKTKAPTLLGGRTAWTTPLRATNRLLVGPFKTEKEARTFVNDLAKLKMDAFSWTSSEGQEITKLPAK